MVKKKNNFDLKFNFRNSFFYIFLFLLIFIFGGILVYASPNPGHSANEIGPGIFQQGDYVFPGRIGVGNNLDLRLVNNGGHFLFFTSNSERFRISTGGNIGIGERNPQELLHVGGNVTARFFIGDGSRLTNLPAGSNWIKNGGMIGYMPGNVGIGTTDPWARLHIKNGNSLIEGGLKIIRNSGSIGLNLEMDPDELHANAPFIVWDPTSSALASKITAMRQEGNKFVIKSYDSVNPYVGGKNLIDINLVNGKTIFGGDLNVVGEIRRVDEFGNTRLWGQGRPLFLREGITDPTAIGYGLGGDQNNAAEIFQESICESSNLKIGRSLNIVSWGDAASACPVGWWVCTMDERKEVNSCGDGFRLSFKMSGGTYSEVTSKYAWVADFADSEMKIIVTGGVVGVESHFSRPYIVDIQGGRQKTHPLDYYPVWCCTYK